MKSFFTLLLFSFSFFVLSQTILPQQTNTVVGPRSILIVRGVDPATHTWNDTDQDLVNFENGLDEYIKKVSFNKTWVGTFDVTPIYNFTVDPNNNGYVQMSEAIGNMATNDGYNLNSYNIVVYIHQSTTDFNGAGALGSGNGLNGSIFGNNNLTFYTAGLIHESFHAFGVGHAECIEGGDFMFPGDNTGGHDPYHFMGSQGDASLNSDIPSYMKYFLGWINPSEIQFIPNASGCNTYRVHKSALVPNYNTNNKYGLQLGQNLWISYDPDNQNSQIVKKGLLLHYINNSGSSITRLLDTRPNSISTLPSGFGNNYLPVIDFWDAAVEFGDEIYWEGSTISILNEGGTGDEKWVDIEICYCVDVSGDSDNDGICDTYDICAGEDDTADNDYDLIPNGCDTCPDDPLNDSNNNNICDNIECLDSAEDNFNYTANSSIENNNGGNGFSNSWLVDSNSMNGSIDIVTGSLEYPNLNNNGNKVRISLINETETKSITRSLNNNFSTGETLWMSILIKANNLANGGFWIKPNNNQSIAFGKRWGTQFGIDNNGSSTNMVLNNTYYLVARYQLLPNETIVHLWINRTEDFNDTNADVTKTVTQSIDINSVSIAMERFGDGVMEFDNLSFNCSPIDVNTLSNTNLEKELDFKIFPNPVKDKLYIETNGIYNFSTKIIDIHGREILSKERNSSTIDLSKIANGVYFIKIYNKESKNTQTQKILVNH